MNTNWMAALAAATMLMPSAAIAQERGGREWRGGHSPGIERRGNEVRPAFRTPRTAPDGDFRQQRREPRPDFRSARPSIPTGQIEPGRSPRENRDFRIDRREARQDFRRERRDDRQALREGRIDREDFRRDRQADRRDFRVDRREDRQDFRRDDLNQRGVDRRDPARVRDDRGRWNNDDRRWNGDRDRRGWNGRDRDWNGRGGYWNRDWRRDRRYDWRDYRRANRAIYRLPRYYGPRGYYGGYRRFGIGFMLGAPLFAQDYWLNDPWAYRLPPVDGPYRWVRYYNDALLVDLDTGEVVDVEYDIFW